VELIQHYKFNDFLIKNEKELIAAMEKDEDQARKIIQKHYI